jgi:hypothetical protein
VGLLLSPSAKWGRAGAAGEHFAPPRVGAWPRPVSLLQIPAPRHQLDSRRAGGTRRAGGRVGGARG